MVLNHIVAVLVFSGPLFWIGLGWRLIRQVWNGDLLVRVPQRVVQKLSGSCAEKPFKPRTLAFPADTEGR